jgi:hypothetical protein
MAALRVFVSYSHDDEALREQLDKHLAPLKRQRLIESWNDRRLLAGEGIDDGIRKELETADVILLLVSASFIHSEYCYTREMARALERNARGEARVVPVILRSCDWQSGPLGNLKAVPRDGKAITSWANADEAYTDVAKEIRALVEHMAEAASKDEPAALQAKDSVAAPLAVMPKRMPRHSTHVRLKQSFSDRDKARFLSEAFEGIAAYFENGLRDMEEQNPGVETDFQRVDKVHFTAFVYRDGKQLSACAVRLNRGSGFGEGITYSNDPSRADGHSYNEHISVATTDHALVLRSMGLASMSTGRRESEGLSIEEASEVLWELLVSRLR